MLVGMRWGFFVLACGLPVAACVSLDGLSGEPAPEDAGTEAGPDASLDAPQSVVDSGPKPSSDPGALKCFNGVECTVPDQLCCYAEVDGSAPEGGKPDFEWGCIPSSQECDRHRFRCDEAADCEAGKVCCGAFILGDFVSYCADSCGAAPVQPCKTDAECKGSKTCVRMECVPGAPIWGCGPNSLCREL